VEASEDQKTTSEPDTARVEKPPLTSTRGPQFASNVEKVGLQKEASTSDAHCEASKKAVGTLKTEVG
jgi:hypothetical protein